MNFSCEGTTSAAMASFILSRNIVSFLSSRAVTTSASVLSPCNGLQGINAQLYIVTTIQRNSPFPSCAAAANSRSTDSPPSPALSRHSNSRLSCGILRGTREWTAALQKHETILRSPSQHPHYSTNLPQHRRAPTQHSATSRSLFSSFRPLQRP